MSTHPTVRPLVREIAKHLDTRNEDRTARAFELEKIDSRNRIRRLKQVLRVEPRNALRWVDLAREYVVLGQPDHAWRAIRVAQVLAPEDRFVLRSTVAFLNERGEFEHAARLLGRTASFDQDPWLLAPYIAVTDLAGRKQRNIRKANQFLEDDRWPPHHKAELAAALGTLELESGTNRRGRQLLRASLKAPTENALAQAVWIENKTGDHLLDNVPSNVPRAFEAMARQFAQELDWHRASAAAGNWLIDQPFSAEAATFAAWVACELDDWTEAASLAADGLRVNSADPALLNLLAYAQIQCGDPARAASNLARARLVEAGPNERAVLMATEGLLLYRLGERERGRARYDQAIAAFTRMESRDLAAEAAIVLAREELGARTHEAPAALDRALRLARSATMGVVRSHATRLKDTWDEEPSSDTSATHSSVGG